MNTEDKLNIRERAYTTNKLRNDQEINNPCYKEHILSLKCLDLNHENHEECNLYFANYRNCRKFWASVEYERRLKNIKPYLPPLEERAKIKDDYLHSK